MVEEKLHSVEGLVPIVDIPSENPEANFKKYAAVLSNFLNNANPPQVTIGIFGGYGSGKTTLMNAIAAELRKISEPKSLLIVGFNAWRHDHEEYLFLPLLAAIHKHIQDDSSVSKHVRSAFLGFVQGVSLKFSNFEISANKLVESVNALLKDNFSKVLGDYIDVYDELGRVSLDEKNSVKRRVVVFIDDLDRCIPEKAFVLLEALKSFMDLRGFMFVLGLDPRAIETYITRKYGKEFVKPEEYLQKMFQVPFHLPRPTEKSMRVILTGLLGEHGSKWAHNIRQELEEKGGLVDFFPRNIRQAKRILNMHQAILLAHDRLKLKPELLLALLIVQVRWPLAYWLLQSFQEDFHEILNACHSNDLDNRVPENILNNASAMAVLRDGGFYRLYKRFILEKAGLTFEGIMPYLELMGWPVDIEAKWNRKE